MKKILSHEEVDTWVAEARRAGRKIGYTCGAFDLLHAGHVDYLTRARELCDVLLVAVNADWSIQQYKNPLRPYCPERERMKVVSALGCVDAVTLLEDPRPVGQIERWKPDFYIKGGDYSVDRLRSAATVKAYGGQAVVIPVSHGVSTTKIVERVLAAERTACPAAAEATAAKGLVMLDRDGTLLKDIPYLSDAQHVELLPGVGEGLAALQGAGFRLVLVTNQQGIGLGYFGTLDFLAVNTALFNLLTPYGVTISRVYYCPHSMADECSCRKPRAGMLVRAMAEFGVAPANCYMIGDREIDRAAAVNAECTAVRVGGGGFADFGAAARWILAQG